MENPSPAMGYNFSRMQCFGYGCLFFFCQSSYIQCHIYAICHISENQYSSCKKALGDFCPRYANHTLAEIQDLLDDEAQILEEDVELLRQLAASGGMVPVDD